MNSRKHRLAEHFHAARDLPAGEARERYLVENLKDDPLLRKELVELLSAADAGEESEVFRTLPREAPKEVVTVMSERAVSPGGALDKPGTMIGPYKLLQEIGEGGFGVVWMAEQIEPVSRRVAIKVIKPGMDTREVMARFEAERQAIAMMDHPNIARVYDAGATAAGRPYFVMELVKGLPVTRFCDEQRLDTAKRLELFTEVCAAVSHAHQKGVIHRDLKPSNILVTLHGEGAVPKVIDFGIAKAVQQKLTDKTLFTRFEQFIGTPVYMSPEQASLSGLDIDTRTDVYSLGVLLYELITGKPPFDVKALLSAGIEEIRRIIREEEPPKPSTRLSTAQGDERTALARAHHADPDKIGKFIRGDLDWIVMKAIEKDRTRRYQTADDFARDLRRFLAHEPVEAVAPTPGYRLRKFIRRHRRLMTASAGAALLLVAASAVSLWQAAEAREARRVSEIARQKAEAVLHETNETLVAEFRSAGKLQFLSGVAETAVRYFADLPEQLRLPATQRLRASAVENLAAVLFARNEVTAASERFAEAIQLRRAILAGAPADQQSVGNLAEALISRSEVLRKLGQHPDALREVTEAASLLSQALRIEDLSSPHLESLARSHHSAALAHAGMSAPEKEAASLEQFAAAAGILSSRKDATVRGRLLLPQALIEQADLALAKDSVNAGAARRYGEAAAALESLNAAMPGDAEIRRNLGIVYDRQGDAFAEQKSWREAVQSYTRYAGTMRSLALQDPTNNVWQRELSIALNECGDTHLKLKDHDAAVTAFDEALTLRRRLAGIDSANVDAQYDLTSSLFRAAEIAYVTGNPSRAVALFSESREIAASQVSKTENPERWRKRHLGSLHRQVLALVRRKGDGDMEAALKVASDGLATVRKLESDPAHPVESRYSSAAFQKLLDQIVEAREAVPAGREPSPESQPASAR